MTTPESAEAGLLVLDGALTVRTSEIVHSKLRQAINDRPLVKLDCSNATEVDLSLVQLLLSARLSAQRSGKTVTLAAPPDGALSDALVRAGFQITTEPENTGFWFRGAPRT